MELTVTAAQPEQSQERVEVVRKGCSYTVIVSVGPLKGSQGVAVKVQAETASAWARAALWL